MRTTRDAIGKLEIDDFLERLTVHLAIAKRSDESGDDAGKHKTEKVKREGRASF
jgi:hypothetical protein